MSRYVYVALCLSCMAVGVRAELPPETEVPYHLTVALRIADHPVLKGVFQEQIHGELHDWLKNSLGAMGQVEIVNLKDDPAVAKDPLLKEVATQGLKALDTWKGVSDHKTHFVFIDYVNGRYEIQARQHDGLTGLSGPTIRRAQTFDRQFLARMAAQLIDRDFGLVGTIDPADKGPEVHVTLKGSHLGVPVDRWIKTGDIFALAQVNQGRGKDWWSFRVPWALLKVTDGPTDGVCRCRLYNRFGDPLRGGATVQGYRCLKLGTTTAHLSLRLVDDQHFLGLPSQQVTISHYGFDSDSNKRVDAVTNWDGLVQTTETYENIAFVRVVNGDVARSLVPVEILGEGALTCPISRVGDEADILAELDLRKKRLIEQLYDGLVMARQLFKELGEIKSHQAARDKAADGEKVLSDEITSRTAELAGLQSAVEKAGADKGNKAISLVRPHDLLEELKGRLTKVQDFKNRVDDVLKKENDPNRAKWATMVQQAQLLEDQAEYDKALELYDQVLKEMPAEDKAPLQKNVDALRAAWKPEATSPEHREARKFIYEEWSKTDSTKQLKEDLPKARAAFEVCKKAGDKLSLRKLLMADLPNASFLKKRIDEIKSQNTEDAREEIKTIAEVGEGLEKLHKDVSDFVQPEKPAA